MIEIKKSGSKYIVEVDRAGFLEEKGFGVRAQKEIVLSQNEVAYLLFKKKVKLDSVDYKSFISKRGFDLEEYQVYKDLRDKGYVVKSGLKYGVNFRVYDKGLKNKKAHSKWLLSVINSSLKLKAKDILGVNRVAHSTKKSLIIAVVDDDSSITYIENNWLNKL